MIAEVLGDRFDRALACLREHLAGCEGAWLAHGPHSAPNDEADGNLHEEILRNRANYPKLQGRYTLAGNSFPLPLPLSVGVALDAAEAGKETIIEHVAAELQRAAELLVGPELLAAVLNRPSIPERWPWPYGSTNPVLMRKKLRAPGIEALSLLLWCLPKPPTGRHAEAVGLGYWPGGASFLDVAEWVREPLNELVPNFRHYSDAPDGQTPGVETKGLGNVMAVQAEHGMPGTDIIAYDVFLPFSGLGLLYLAVHEIEKGRRMPVLRLGATRAARAAIRALAAGPPKTETYPWDLVAGSHSLAEGRPHRWAELVWSGRPRPLQLRLNFADRRNIDGALLRDLLSELRADGVRDWLVLHRMAAEQGATGNFRWTWADHRERTDYARRVASKNATDADLAAAAMRRISRMQQAELRWYRPGADRDTLEWVRIGPPWLVDIPAGIEVLHEAGRSLQAAAMSLNPATYKGARRGAEKPHFVLVPESALELPAAEMRLLAHLSFDWTYAQDPDGVCRKASTLWDYAGIRTGRETPKRRWKEATATLERVLARLATGAKVEWEPDGESGLATSRYRIRPPDWWNDRVLFGVSPHYARLASVPRTWGELRTWRRSRSLTQQQIADAIGVSRGTVARNEKARERAIRPEWIAALGSAM